MIIYTPNSENLILDCFKLKVGDLVTTILGEFGIVLGFGNNSVCKTDKTEYYFVLVDGYVRNYLPHALIKIK